MHPTPVFQFGLSRTLFETDAPPATEATPSDASDLDRLSYEGPTQRSGPGEPAEFAAFRAAHWPRAKARMTQALDRLTGFAEAHGLPIGHLPQLRHRLDAGDGAYFGDYLPQLYGRGLRVLDRLIDLLTQEQPPPSVDLLAQRRRIFKRLVSDPGSPLDKCGMAVVDGMEQAALDLAAADLGGLRRIASRATADIVRQTALLAEHTVPHADSRPAIVSLEIHHVTAAIDELGLDGSAPRRDDSFSPPEGRVAELLDPLRERLRHALSPMRLARHLGERCVQELESALGAWLAGEPLDLVEGRKHEADQQVTSHWQGMATQVARLGADYGPLPLDSFAQAGAGDRLPSPAASLLVAAHIRRRLSDQQLAVPEREQELRRWRSAGGPRRLTLMDDDLMLLDAGDDASSPLMRPPAARHLVRLWREHLRGSAAGAAGAALWAAGGEATRSRVLRDVMTLSSAEDLARVSPAWLANADDAVAMRARLGARRFAHCCTLAWPTPMPSSARIAVLDAAERVDDHALLADLLADVTPPLAAELWTTARLTYFRKLLRKVAPRVTASYLWLAKQAMSGVSHRSILATFHKLWWDADRQCALTALPAASVDALTALTEAALALGRLRGDLLLELIATPDLEGRPSLPLALMSDDVGADKLRRLLGGLARMADSNQVPLPGLILLMRGRSSIRTDVEPGPDALCIALSKGYTGGVRTLADWLVSDDGPARLDEHRLTALLMGRDDEDPCPTPTSTATATAIAHALQAPHTGALQAWLGAMATGLKLRRLSDIAVMRLLLSQTEDASASVLARGLLDGRLDAVECVWRWLLAQWDCGRLTTCTTTRLLRQPGRDGTPALAQAFHHDRPEAVDRYYAALADGTERQGIDQVDLDQVLRPTEADGWPVGLRPNASSAALQPLQPLKRQLRGLKTLIELGRVKASTVMRLLTQPVDSAPSLVEAALAHPQAAFGALCMDELARWREADLIDNAMLHEAFAGAGLARLASVTALAPGLDTLLDALRTALMRRWITPRGWKTLVQADDAHDIPLLARLMGHPAGTESPLKPVRVWLAAVLAAARTGLLHRETPRRLLEGLRPGDVVSAAYRACVAGHASLLQVWLESVQSARRAGFISESDWIELIAAYGPEDQLGEDAAAAAGHTGCLVVLRGATT